MQKYQTLEDAIALAEFAHRHQKDKSGAAYIDHPKRVLATVQAQGARPYAQTAAVLHDVIEDTPFTAQMLLDLGFSEAAVQLVVLLTRTDDVPPDFYYDAIMRNPDARMIKVADISDNLQEWRLSYLTPTTQQRLRLKYQRALEALGVVQPPLERTFGTE